MSSPRKLAETHTLVHRYLRKANFGVDNGLEYTYRKDDADARRQCRSKPEIGKSPSTLDLRHCSGFHSQYDIPIELRRRCLRGDGESDLIESLDMKGVRSLRI
uniref:Uncharacterized protein n=1 Tax=Grammatophora oceanica TaxID=210454 RepID=A0A6U5L7U9_9STRA